MTTLTFTHPEFFLLFAAIPLLILAHVYLFKFTRRRGMHFSNFETLKRITGKEVATKNISQLILRLIVFSLIVFALTQPIYLYEGFSQTTDYVITIDASGTMTTTDIGPMRFEVAKQAALEFVDRLGDANVGVVSYAGLLTIHQTPTNDLEAVRQSIRDMEIPRLSGTDLGSAIVTSSNLLLGSEQGRAVVLFTDGGSTVSAFATDPLMRGTMYAKENRVVVHTVGIGRDNEALVGYLPTLYNLTARYNEEDLRYLSEQTGGQYVHIQSVDEVGQSIAQLVLEAESKLQERDLSFALLVSALFLLFLEWGLTNTRFRMLP